jgi:hypothetical protein
MLSAKNKPLWHAQLLVTTVYRKQELRRLMAEGLSRFLPFHEPSPSSQLTLPKSKFMAFPG